ncbi:MAG: hypothetical protein KatS3mg011_2278 [Acidimicrobiia bacterium]|nr:MAG: hypothetical protein KatS3mg011_2278 [Acidimicrobiia bacterium]
MPATVVITEPFQTLVATQARALGLAGYHHVMVPHPISSKDEPYLRRLAREVADAVLRQLVGE